MGLHEVVVIDLEAGLEHLGRRTAEAADALLVVVDPTSSSAETAHRIARLATDIGMRRVLLVGNRITDPIDLGFIRERLPDLELAGAIPYSPGVLAAERDGRPLVEIGGPVAAAIALLVDHLTAGVREEVRS